MALDGSLLETGPHFLGGQGASSRVVTRSVMDSGRPFVFAHGNPTKPLSERDYFDRALLLGDSRDVILTRSIDQDYLRYLCDVGFDLPKVVCLGQENERESLLGELVRGVHQVTFEDHDISFFSGVHIRQKVADAIGARYVGPEDSSVLDRFIDKRGYQNLSKELGVPIVEGTVYNMLGESSTDRVGLGRVLETMLEDHDSLILRANKGSGCNFDVSRANLESTLSEICEGSGKDKAAFLIDPKVNVVNSPNVTFYVDETGKIHFIGRSIQVQDGLKYLGNEFDFSNEDTCDEIMGYSLRYADEIAKTGYVGFFGLDFLVTDDNSVYGCEINLRINGSNYVRSGIERVEQITDSPVQFARAKILDVPRGISSFSDFRNRFGPLLFDGSNSSGILPYKTSLLGEGKIDAIIMGSSREDVDRLEREYNIISSYFQ